MELLILIIVLAVLAETSYLIFSKHRPAKSNKRKIYVDTSVLIDGRILNIARTGIIGDDLIILRSVLRELQILADNKDGERRTLGRTGLDNVAELERVLEVNTEIFDDGEGRKQVDEELLKHAKENGGAVLTIDFNLIKVAEAEKIPTININDLALAVKTQFSPSDELTLKITEKGSGAKQGVGHLPNGTMVIVENAENKIGTEVQVQLLRLHETSAGKMFFAKIIRNRK